MRVATECPACGGRLGIRKRARVAPFVAERVWNRASFSVTLERCENCELSFFNPRLEPDEEGRLYRNYRSAEYQRSRYAHEPWYTEALNRQLEHDEQVVQWRASLISSLIGDRHVTRVLDFGGNGGQFVSRLSVRDKFVFDISGVPVVAGVTAITDFARCAEHCYDLITCTHVLEHVGSPAMAMLQIAELSRTGTLLYLEVPDEAPFAPITRLREAAHVCLTRTRDAFAIIRPGMLRIMHEHVNYFTPRSLQVLAERAGFRVLQSAGFRVEGALPSSVLWCFGIMESIRE